MRKKNNIFKYLILVVLIVLAGNYILQHEGQFRMPGTRRAIAGIEAPVLAKATGQKAMGEIDGYQLTAEYLYSCDIRGLVVSERHYNAKSIEDKIAPVDVVLAWGKVAEYNDKIDFGWQQPMRRTLAWTDNEEAYAQIGGSKMIYQCCTDACLIPADESVKQSFSKIKTGDCLRVIGYLVNVNGNKSDGSEYGFWTGELARNLKGENDEMFSVVYVTNVEWLD